MQTIFRRRHITISIYFIILKVSGITQKFNNDERERNKQTDRQTEREREKY